MAEYLALTQKMFFFVSFYPTSHFEVETFLIFTKINFNVTPYYKRNKKLKLHEQIRNFFLKRSDEASKTGATKFGAIFGGQRPPGGRLLSYDRGGATLASPQTQEVD